MEQVQRTPAPLATEAMAIHLRNIEAAADIPHTYHLVAPAEIVRLIGLANVYQIDWTLGREARQDLRDGEVAIPLARWGVWEDDGSGTPRRATVWWEAHYIEDQFDDVGRNIVPALSVEHTVSLSSEIQRRAMEAMTYLVRPP